MRYVTLFSFFLAVALSLSGAELYHIGDSAFWTTGEGIDIPWAALNGANDGADTITGVLDFVGDTSNPGLYWASTDNFLFFRSRINAASVASGDFTGAHFVLIDVVGFDYVNDSGLTAPENNPNRPDYGITWDSKSNDPEKHGMEMSVIDTRSNVWNGINMDDLDGSSGQKLEVDINGNNRTEDGYIRTIDAQTTDNLGDTTFLDFAVSWNYLTTYTGLSPEQEWQIVLASIPNATDHNNLVADISGGVNPPDSSDLGWILIPEPSSFWMILIAGGASSLGLLRRFRHKTTL